MVRFGVVGLVATLVHYAALTVLVELLAIPPALANGLSFCAAVAVSYFGQASWVFNVDRKAPQAPARFGLIAVLGLLANVGIMAVSHDMLGLDYRIGFIVSVVIVPMLTFLANKFWVFRPHRA